jgi:hypothetical protein
MPDRFDFDHLGERVRCIWCGAGGPVWRWRDDRREAHSRSHDPSAEEVEAARCVEREEQARGRRDRRHRTLEWTSSHPVRTCAYTYCAEEFIPARSTRRYCSDRCRKAASRAQDIA